VDGACPRVVESTGEVPGSMRTAFFVLLVLASAPAGAEPLVDCADPSVQSPNSVGSLLSWAKTHADEILGGNPSEFACGKARSYLGAAWCKDPDKDGLGDRLTDVLAACAASASAPSTPQPAPAGSAPAPAGSAPASGPDLVDCASEAMQSVNSVGSLVAWAGPHVDEVLSGNASAQRCSSALENLGPAWCKAPTDPGITERLSAVLGACGDSAEARSRTAVPQDTGLRFLAGGVELDARPERGETGRDDESPGTALYYGAYLAAPAVGAITGDLSVQVLREGEVIAEKSEGRFFMQGGDVGRVGNAGAAGHRLRGERADLLLDTEPGEHVLRIVVSPDGGAELETRVPFRLSRIATTGGFGLGIEARVPTQAALRTNTRPFGVDGSREQPFWITLPVDLRQEKTRVDMLWDLEGARAGTFSWEIDIHFFESHTPVVLPLRVWGGPDGVTTEQLRARVGNWAVHVVRDGEYLTTCTFAVDASGFVGLSGDMVPVPCATWSGPTIEAAVAYAEEHPGHRPEGFRALEIPALHGSAEIRALRLQKLNANRAAAKSTGIAVAAEKRKRRARTDEAAAEAAREQQAAEEAARSAAETARALDEEYRALVKAWGG